MKNIKRPQQVAKATKSHLENRQIFSPFNRFSLDICQHLEFTPVWQMPRIAGTMVGAPTDLTAFYREVPATDGNTWRHFYTDDRRLLPFITNPYQMAEQLRQFPAVTGLDLSLKPEMPLPEQMAVSFYNKMIMAFWQHKGLTVVQNIIWGRPDSYSFCFDGYAKHSVVAVNSTGIGTDRRSCFLWDQGYEAMLDALEPTLIIRYGAKRPVERTDISVYFENDNKKASRYGR